MAIESIASVTLIILIALGFSVITIYISKWLQRNIDIYLVNLGMQKDSPDCERINEPAQSLSTKN